MVTGSVVLAGIVLHGRRITKLVLRFVHRKDFDELASLATSFVTFLLPVPFLAAVCTNIRGDALPMFIRSWSLFSFVILRVGVRVITGGWRLLLAAASSTTSSSAAATLLNRVDFPL